MGLRADHCGLHLSTGHILFVWRDKSVISWSCRNDDLKSVGSLGNFVQVKGLDYELYTSSQNLGTLKAFRLEDVDPDRTYQVVLQARNRARSGTLSAKICDLSFEGNYLLTGRGRELGPLPGEGHLQSVDGDSIAGIGATGFVKGTRIP
jgi:hypothetical protein